MKSSKCLLLLAALVGFGLAGNSHAALLSSIEIVSPDSGAIRGIDSVIVVKATVTDYVGVGNGGNFGVNRGGNASTDEAQILMYLRTDAGPLYVPRAAQIAATWSQPSSDLPRLGQLRAAFGKAGTDIDMMFETRYDFDVGEWAFSAGDNTKAYVFGEEVEGASKSCFVKAHVSDGAATGRLLMDGCDGDFTKDEKVTGKVSGAVRKIDSAKAAKTTKGLRGIDQANLFYAATKRADQGNITSLSTPYVMENEDSLGFVGPSYPGAGKTGKRFIDWDGGAAYNPTELSDVKNHTGTGWVTDASNKVTTEGEWLTATTTGDVTTFTWRVKIRPGAVSATTGIYAEAIAYDDSDDKYTAVKNTKATSQISIDTERPVVPGQIISVSVAGAYSAQYSRATAATGNYGPDIVPSAAQGDTPLNTWAPDGNEGGKPRTKAKAYKIAGIGDTFTIDVNLGTTTQAYAAGDSLEARMDFLGKTTVLDKGNRSGQVLSQTIKLTEGYAGNLDVTGAVPTVRVYYVDKAGNESYAVNVHKAKKDYGAAGLAAVGTFITQNKDTRGSIQPYIAGGNIHALRWKPNAGGNPNGILVDATSPVLDSIRVAKGDTITDGTLLADNNMKNDTNVALFGFLEPLDSLIVSFNDPRKVRLEFSGTQIVKNAMTGAMTGETANAGKEQAAYPFAFTDMGDNDKATKDVKIGAIASVTTASVRHGLGREDSLLTGLYTMTVRGVDFAGNASTKAIDSVYVDSRPVLLNRPFPTNLAFGATTNSELFRKVGTDARVDTVDEETAKVVFQLSEPADSVRVIYTRTAGADATGKVRARALSGTQLLNTTAEQQTGVEGLVDNTQYKLEIETIDLAGNHHKYTFGDFYYDADYSVPVIKRFLVTAKDGGNTKFGSGNKVAAGAAVTLTIKADASTDNSLTANSYKAAAILKVAGGGPGLTLSGTGVTDLGGGRATLSELDWAVGQRTVTLKDTIAGETLTVSVVDSVSANGPFAGALDSAIVTQNAAFDTISVMAPATVDVGESFRVDVSKKDKYGNVVPGIEYYTITTDQIGVELPTGAQQLKDGAGGFTAQANSAVGALEFKIRATIAAADKYGIATTNVVAGSGLDAPNALVAEDYTGADGAGDQGGFVVLTWDPSDDHGTLDGYRIYREVQVSQGAGTDADGNATIVALEAPAAAMVPWASVDAVPGEAVGRAIVATLDNVATKWGVSSERGGAVAGAAKAVSVEAISAYEAMARTMQQSRDQVAVEGPVFATLLPEALAFAENGVAPRFNLFGSEMARSSITETKEAVRAIDNIAPTAVPFLRVLDTPADEGNSITLTWTKSESDRMLARSASNAVSIGSMNDMVAGVVGYNIYRKVGAQGEYTLIGKAAAGATSFADETALNGVRYTYSVSPYDHDNIAEASTERTAMAIRNSARDSQGKVVQGLFGSDNTVGFDDFFIFADNFGITAADEVFEPAFDLSPNAGLPRVDFDDFFVFADNFGRSIQAAGKVVPMLAGLNTDARLYLETAADLPNVGEEVVVNVDMADFVQMKGYGLSVAFDAEQVEFVRATTTNSLLGEGEFATPRTIAQADGKVEIAAYGDMVTEGELGLSLVFRTKTQIENTEIEVTGSQVSDGSLGVNAVALPAPVQIQTRPEAFALANNYPNPFNPATTIKYALPEASQVRLEVFNTVGQVVRTMVDAHQNAGRYVVEWDATSDNGVNLSSGIYFYRLQVEGNYLEVKKMLLLK